MRTKLYSAGLPALIAIVLLARGGAGERAEPRLDELHSTRPAAARAVVQDHADLRAYLTAIEAAHLEAYVQAVAAADYAAAAEVAAAERSSRSSSGRSRDSGGFLACTRGIESHGDYGAVSSEGTYRGAYQFHQATWNSTAAAAGRSDLVGRDPATVSPADQDAMAVHLYDGGNGASHWGGRCR